MPKLLSSLPVGAVVKDTQTTYNGKPILFTVMEHNHAGDPADSTALITKHIISLKCFDASEPSNDDSNRKLSGNNRYLYSNLKQWLNSDAKSAAEGDCWYIPQHDDDWPPASDYVFDGLNAYEQEAGFLNGFSEQLKGNLLNVSKRTAKNKVTDGGGYEEVTGKIFLLSKTEIGEPDENGVAEGSRYALFESDDDRKATLTQDAVEQSDNNGNLSADENYNWWLRTVLASDSSRVYPVWYNGHTTNAANCAYFGFSYGVRPACVVPSSILVSDKPDSDGAYQMLWNLPPEIVVDEGENLGDKNVPFAIHYTITDADGDEVTAVLTLDGETVQAIDSVVPGYRYSYQISGETMNSLEPGSHTIVIMTKDSNENESSQTVTFQKVATAVTISGMDSSMGNCWQMPEYTYSVTDMEGKAVTVTEMVNETEIRTIENAGEEETILFDLSEIFMLLESETTHTLTIKAVNADGEEAYRYITFKKLPSFLCFKTKPKETDVAAEKILVNVDYEKQGNPDLKVEVTNCAYNEKVVWENATEAVLDRKAYLFQNTIFDNGRYGVAVRVTILKNADTERVYCYNLGICFD